MSSPIDKQMAEAVHEMLLEGIETCQEADRLMETALDLISYSRVSNAKKVEAEGELLIQSARILQEAMEQQ